MYQVYVNGKVLFENGVNDLYLTQAVLDLELGKSGSFVFTIYPDHLNFAAVEIMAPVTVFRGNEIIYRGRILDIKYGFYGEKQVSCEGELAFLLDVMVPPHTYAGSFHGYLDYVLGIFNRMVEAEKSFFTGNITVPDFTNFSVTEKAEYRTVFDTLTNNMVNRSGGYLQVRTGDDGNRYLDLLKTEASGSNVSGQEIELGKNLLDISRESKGEGLFSVIIPLGAKLAGSEQRLNIKAVNSNLEYIENSAAVALCKGKIYRTVVFDNITNATTLKTEGTKHLAENYAGEYSVEVTAADLSGIDTAVDIFRVGQWVRVYNEYHFGYTPQLFLVQKLSINLLKPAENKLVIGQVKKGLAVEVAGLSNSVENISVPEAVQPYVMESGTTGIWNWKKFSDNTCEFFGKVPITSADVTSAFGSWYRGANLYEATMYPYPVQLTEAPAVELTFHTRNGLAAMIWINSPDADSARQYLPQAFLIRPTTATGIFGNINIIAKGKY